MFTPIPDPQIENFGVIAPGTTAAGEITINTAPSNSAMTAKISDGAPIFGVALVTAWEWKWEPVDPGELPPGHKGPPPKHRVLEQVGQSNGTTPLAVSNGQLIKIGLNATTPGQVHVSAKGNGFSGTLLIEGDGWSPVQVPLVASLAHVKSSLGVNALTIAQGQTGQLPISSQSVAGPDTTVQFFLHDGPESAGVTMDPASIHLPSGQSGSTTLTLHVAPGAAVGTRTLFFSESAFDGAQHDSVVPGATLTIGVGQVLVSSPAAFSGVIVPPEGSSNVELDVLVGGAATDV